MATEPAIVRHMATVADALRCRLLRVLARQELTVTELCSVLQLPQSTVSRHLKTLADDGWVLSRRDGTSRFYGMAPERLAPEALRLWNIIQEQLEGAAGDEDDRRVEAVLSGRREKSRAFFATAAGEWSRLREELFGDRFQFEALLGLLDDRWTVGDLGCGTGEVTATLAPFVRRVIAVDGSTEMLAAARERLRGVANVDLRAGELERLPLRPALLDAAVVMLVLHYVPEPTRVLREAARVLKPGGRLLVVDMLPHQREEFQQRMGHVWLGFAPEQIERFLEAAGFGAARMLPLPPAPAARGPGLFAATARKAGAAPSETPAEDAEAGGARFDFLE
jgi:SAM-dependent methyltransferase